MKNLRNIQLVPKLLCLLASAVFISNLAYSKDVIVNGSRVERSLRDMYEEDDLGACCLFSGDFINFGYWQGLSQSDDSLTEENRAESSKALYRLVGKAIGISSKDNVLEVGCGKGAGASLILEEFNPQTIKGIDFSDAQIKRAQKVNPRSMKNDRLSFQCAAAEKIPFRSFTFDKVLSVEAAQHFENLDGFFNEAYRILKPNGKIGVAAFFATSSQSFKPVSSMIQTVHDGIDKMYPIQEIRKSLEHIGYKNIKIESIGAHVWPSFDKWVAQTDLKDSWTRNWYKAFQQNLVDYYMITAEKSNVSSTQPITQIQNINN